MLSQNEKLVRKGSKPFATDTRCWNINAAYSVTLGIQTKVSKPVPQRLRKLSGIVWKNLSQGKWKLPHET